MQVEDLSKVLNYECLVEGNLQDKISEGYTSDLLSDVMGNAPDDSVLITIQAHKNTIAVASLVGIKAVVICNNRPSAEDMIEAAKEENIGVYLTRDNQFLTSYNIQKVLLNS